MSRTLIDDPAKAEKLATAIANDIKLYNADKIKAATSFKDLLENQLSDAISEGRQLYTSRVAEAHIDLFERAIHDILGEAWL
jgi:hypothetical protein